MRSAVLSLAVLAATALAAPVKDCAIKYARDVVVEYVDITVTQTVYVTEGAAPTTTPCTKNKVVPVTTVTYEAPAYTPEPAPSSYQAPVYNAPAPSPSPQPAPPPTAPTSDDQKCLEAHNSFRAKHGAGALTWSQEMADYARDKTQDCSMHHSGGPYGENLAFGYGDVVSAVTAWYDEKNQYSDGTGFSMGTGHFTQLVWKATTEIGCYNRQCGGSQYLMCEYRSPGNVMGNNNEYFRENVQM
ncbi:hypothetical protein H072_2995 [Dactylellina haptotyla CBS 200.50]|uniref:SCP domain-containing protein n=1 Tax=Dactylellina haptotyla (strain CBS 200.50) TaxID=1284197 RepID=S8AJC3_DACHA|nr:hypothetical protein H072_2995 [Dactylellina haptotyla CBS 200.50]